MDPKWTENALRRGLSDGAAQLTAAWFWVVEGILGPTGAIAGRQMITDMGPTLTPNMIAAVSGFGSVLAFAAFVFLVQIFRAPYRQRDEARAVVLASYAEEEIFRQKLLRLTGHLNIALPMLNSPRLRSSAQFPEWFEKTKLLIKEAFGDDGLKEYAQFYDFPKGRLELEPGVLTTEGARILLSKAHGAFELFINQRRARSPVPRSSGSSAVWS